MSCKRTRPLKRPRSPSVIVLSSDDEDDGPIIRPAKIASSTNEIAIKTEREDSVIELTDDEQSVSPHVSTLGSSNKENYSPERASARAAEQARREVASPASRSPSVDLFAEDQQDGLPLPPSMDAVYDASPTVTDAAGADDIPRARVVTKGPFRPPLEEPDMSRAPWDSSPPPSPQPRNSRSISRPALETQPEAPTAASSQDCPTRDLRTISASLRSRGALPSADSASSSAVSFIQDLRALSATYNALSPRSREVLHSALTTAPLENHNATASVTSDLGDTTVRTS